LVLVVLRDQMATLLVPAVIQYLILLPQTVRQADKILAQVGQMRITLVLLLRLVFSEVEEQDQVVMAQEKAVGVALYHLFLVHL
jgi:hypothetical protein